jgi:hypothetical protein
MMTTGNPRLSRRERFEAAVSSAVHARAADVALARGASHYALGILGRVGMANIELFYEETGTRVALNGRSLRQVRRAFWNDKNLTRRFRA